MILTRRFKVEKLVRDKMPKRMQKLGGRVEIHYLDSQSYLRQLKLKLLEEAEELLASSTPKDIKEEIADVLEVLHAIAKCHGLQFEHIEKKRIQKQQERGGFEKAIFVETVEVDVLEDSHPILEYCLANPEEYPEIL